MHAVSSATASLHHSPTSSSLYLSLLSGSSTSSRGEDAWALDTFSSGPPAVTLRQGIALLAAMRRDPLLAGVRRQRHIARVMGSAGGWLCIGGLILCLVKTTPDAAGVAALGVGVGCAVGGAWQAADVTLRLLRRDTAGRARRRLERLELLRDLSDQLPHEGNMWPAKEKAFAAVVDVTEAMFETVSMTPRGLAADVATESVRGCLWALLAGFAGTFLAPWALWLGRVTQGEAPARGSNVVLSIVAALVGGGLPFLVAVAHRAGSTAGAWRQLQGLAARPAAGGDVTPRYGLDPDLLLGVRLSRSDLGRLFGHATDTSADDGSSPSSSGRPPSPIASPPAYRPHLPDDSRPASAQGSTPDLVDESGRHATAGAHA